jgi:hypothetical protein
LRFKIFVLNEIVFIGVHPWLIISRAMAGVEFGLNGGQFSVRFVGDMVHLVGAPIPIAAVAQVTFDLVQHGVNPRGRGVAFVLLDQFMRSVPLAGQSQFNRFEQIIVRGAHGGCDSKA